MNVQNNFSPYQSNKKQNVNFKARGLEYLEDISPEAKKMMESIGHRFLSSLNADGTLSFKDFVELIKCLPAKFKDICFSINEMDRFKVPGKNKLEEMKFAIQNATPMKKATCNLIEDEYTTMATVINSLI